MRWLSLCSLLGHRWEWVEVREGLGCVDRMRCWRCGHMPAYPMGGAVWCGRGRR